MEVLDNSFFEAFKKLEKLCNDVYSCEHGVSEYITKMEESEEKGLETVPLWHDQYKKIKHWRWLRNRLAHEGESGICTATDYTELRLFYDGMLAGKDPLTQLKKAEESSAGKKKPAKEVKSSAKTKQEKNTAAEVKEKGRVINAKDDTAPKISQRLSGKSLGTVFETENIAPKSKAIPQTKKKTSATTLDKAKAPAENSAKKRKETDYELINAVLIGMALVVIIIIICLIIR